MSRPGLDVLLAACPCLHTMARKLRLEYPALAERLHLGKPNGARTNLHKYINDSQSQTPEPQLNLE